MDFLPKTVVEVDEWDGEGVEHFVGDEDDRMRVIVGEFGKDGELFGEVGNEIFF